MMLIRFIYYGFNYSFYIFGIVISSLVFFDIYPLPMDDKKYYLYKILGDSAVFITGGLIFLFRKTKTMIDSEILMIRNYSIKQEGRTNNMFFSKINKINTIIFTFLGTIILIYGILLAWIKGWEIEFFLLPVSYLLL